MKNKESLIRKIYRHITRQLAVRRNVRFHRDLHVGRRTLIMAPSDLTIGPRVKIGNDTWIATDGVIEEGVVISSQVGIIGRYDHDVWGLGRRPYDAPSVWLEPDKITDAHRVHIERDVWIGFNATILSGVKIGRGSIVGAGSVVTRDVQPYSIVVGNPARQIGQIFHESEIQKHEEILSARQTELGETSGNF